MHMFETQLVPNLKSRRWKINTLEPAYQIREIQCETCKLLQRMEYPNDTYNLLDYVHFVRMGLVSVEIIYHWLSVDVPVYWI